MRRFLGYIFHVLLLTTVIWGIIVISMYYWLTTVNPESVGRRVPDVTAIYISDAILKLWEKDLSFEVNTVNADINVGYVIAQIPVAGTLIGSGEKVTLIVSGGKKTATIPDVVGKPATKAIDMLRERGLHIKDVLEVSDGGHFVVKSITPSEGSKVALGSGVILTISIPKQTKVPYVVGLPLPMATKKITDAQLKIGEITYVYAEGVKLETVKSQFPRSGVYRWVGDHVDLEVWTGDYKKTVESDENR